VNTFAVRHGETPWSVSGQHTGTTDIPLTDNGRRIAERMRPALAKQAFALVLVSPMQRARETCQLTGLGGSAVVDNDSMEWNYGKYEGLTPQQISEVAPCWLIFRDGCPGGETPKQVGQRVDRAIARMRMVERDVPLLAYGRTLRVPLARWIGLSPSADDPERAAANAKFVAAVERMYWRLWNGTAQDTQLSIDRIRAAMHHFPAEPGGRTSRPRESFALPGTRRMAILPARVTGWSTNADRHRPGCGLAQRSPRRQPISW
jgi:broad specificity phosphatase PhoE